MHRYALFTCIMHICTLFIYMYSLSMCIYAYVCIVYVHVCIFVWGQMLMSGDFLDLIPPHMLTQSLLLNAETIQLCKLTSRLALRWELGKRGPDPLPLLPEPWDYRQAALPNFSCVFWGSELRSLPLCSQFFILGVSSWAWLMNLSF